MQKKNQNPDMLGKMKLVYCPQISSGGKNEQVGTCKSVKYAVVLLHANILKLFLKI